MEQTAELRPTPENPVFPPSASTYKNSPEIAEQAGIGETAEPLPYRILVVEDEPSFLELMLPLLQRRHPIVDTASDGKQAQKLIQQAKYDLVLSDLRMPNVDGMALLAWIKKQQSEMDVILMTGELSPEAEQEARQKGAAEFLTKPFSSKKLLAAIERCRRDQANRTAGANRAMDPAALLLKPLIHDMAAGLENAATMLKMSQRAFQGAGAEKAGSQLETVNANLFKLMGLTEEYCSLFLSLDQRGEIPTGRYDLQVDAVEVVLDELANDIRRKQISMECKRDKYAAYFARPVQANRVLLSSAFRTLFANAIRHCRQGGTITYGFADTEKTHRLNISYEGQPLTEKMRLAVMADTKAGNGTGYGNSSEAFGLSVALSIIRQYGGSLACKPEHGGCCLQVTMPTCRTGAPSEVSCPAGQ